MERKSFLIFMKKYVIILLKKKAGDLYEKVYSYLINDNPTINFPLYLSFRR